MMTHCSFPFHGRCPSTSTSLRVAHPLPHLHPPPPPPPSQHHHRHHQHLAVTVLVPDSIILRPEQGPCQNGAEKVTVMMRMMIALGGGRRRGRGWDMDEALRDIQGLAFQFADVLRWQMAWWWHRTLETA